MKKLLRNLRKISLVTLLSSAVGFADSLYEHNVEGDSGDVVSREPSYPNYKAAQTFEIGAVGPDEHLILNRIRLELWKQGNPFSDLTVAIYNVDRRTGKPKDLILETKIPASELSENREWHEIPFPEDMMNKNKSYAVVLSGEGDRDNTYWWGINDADSYPGGGAYLYDSGHLPGEWWKMGPPISTERDFKFEVYGDSKVKGPKK